MQPRSSLEQRRDALRRELGLGAGNGAAVVARASERPAEGARQTVIQPVKRLGLLDLRELWHYREVLGIFVWRDVKVKYKQTSIGVAWAVLQPVLQMVVFTLVFGKFAHFPSLNVPYPIFVYSGQLLWNYFSTSLNAGSASLVANNSLVTKVYFPRVLLPLASILSPIVDFLIALAVLAGMMAWFSIYPGIEILLAPLYILLALLAAFAFSLFFSALNVRYRDVPYAIPFLVQIWMFLSPVVYATKTLKAWEQWVFAANPMYAPLMGFRSAMIGTPGPTPGQIALGAGVTAVALILGLHYFRRAEPRFADTI
jgi:lipopolysaccharide transport system permease protein